MPEIVDPAAEMRSSIWAPNPPVRPNAGKAPISGLPTRGAIKPGDGDDCRSPAPINGNSHAHQVLSRHAAHRCRRYYDALHHTTEQHHG